jgi:hypothetical protein
MIVKVNGRPWVRNPMKLLNFSIYIILPATLGPGIFSAADRNGYKKQKNKSGEQRVASM